MWIFKPHILFFPQENENTDAVNESQQPEEESSEPRG